MSMVCQTSRLAKHTMVEAFVQLTWRDNYARATTELNLKGTKLDMEVNASRALDLILAAGVMFKGMAQGWFTGKKLSDYFDADSDDPVGARKIINPDDKGTLIAGYHNDFLSAIHKSWIESDQEPIELAIRVSSPVPVKVTIQGDAVDG